ncbi:putative suppressor of disruption of TFIIS [Rhizina undulata]
MTFPTTEDRPVFFFDIDNCLYSRSKRVHDMMKELIDKYFREQLDLASEDAKSLHETYYKNYGLAIEGLVRHHKIDPLEYNRQVDDALPLGDVLHPDPTLRKLLSDIDRSKVRLWLFTNAYITHGRRVVKLLDVEEFFDGITYCDYGEETLVCKPKHEMFEKAMREAKVTDRSQCYFIDDSYINCKSAVEFGWKKTVHKLEPDDPEPEVPACDYHVKDLNELRTLFPEVFITK